MIEDADVRSLQDRFDMRYKKLVDCDKEMDEAKNTHHALEVRLTVIEHGQKVNNWLTGVIASGIIALVIKVFLGG